MRSLTECKNKTCSYISAPTPGHRHRTSAVTPPSQVLTINSDHACWAFFFVRAIETTIYDKIKKGQVVLTDQEIKLTNKKDCAAHKDTRKEKRITARGRWGSKECCC